MTKTLIDRLVINV